MKIKKSLFPLILLGAFFIGGISYFTYRSQQTSLKKQSAVENTTFDFPYSFATISKGKALYEINCVVCHGLNGEGENVAIPGGGLNNSGQWIAPALDTTGHAWSHTDQQLIELIQNGSTEKNSPMIGFKHFSKEDTLAILTYIKTLWGPEIYQLRESYTEDLCISKL